MTQLSLDTAQGEILKKQGQATVIAGSLSFVQFMQAQAIEISDKCGFVSSDNLRVIAEELGMVPHHPNVWGSIFRGKHWRVIGRKKSAVVGNHGRSISIWRHDENPSAT